MYLLDTNVISELRKADKANRQVTVWAEQTDIQFMYISVISILEIRLGILSLKRKDKKQGDMLNNWLLQQVIPTFSERILAIDLPIALQCAELHVPDPHSERDALIAATALVHKLALATRNTKDFEFVGLKTINPWLESV